ncbi:hypothetical protein [Streptomyces sp. NPDC091278]|uniref:hypothetical protein n=1 Tax=Streptomyces sp. NPDC091278 TaxID=3155301 RepID=UPI00344D8BE6
MSNEQINFASVQALSVGDPVGGLGSDLVGGLGSDPGAVPGAGLGREPGVGLGREPGFVPGSGPGSGPGGEPGNDPGWDRLLAEGFAALIGRPLEEYGTDAVYAAGIGGNLMYETDFRQDLAWVRPEALSGAEPVVWDCPLFGEGDKVPAFDASRSLFEFPALSCARTALPPELAEALAAVEIGHGMVRGADLAPLLAAHAVDLADPAHAGTWTVYHAVLVSDGSLLGALKAALVTGDRPEDLIDFGTEPDEEGAEELAAVAHDGLRTHLGHFRSDGDVGMVTVTEEGLVPGVLHELGCAPVAGWEDGHGQIDIAVLRLSDRVTGRAPRRA